MTATEDLPYRLERTVTIRARRETVFRFFTDPARWASWWGEGSSIDARPGGTVVIRYPNGVEAGGKVIEVLPPERIAFTYGYASGSPIPVGASRVEIYVEAVGANARVRVRHAFAEAATRDAHIQGWRYQLSLFANVVADDVHAGAGSAVDDWFRAWGESDSAVRDAIFARIAEPQVRFHDRFSTVEGLADLSEHLAAVQRFMPGIQLRRYGDIRHCQGVVVVDWVAETNDGQERARGTNVFLFGADGRVEMVTGLWNQPQR